jgi:hypothetical protein
VREVTRASLTRMVYRQLTDPQFRDRLTAVTPDGDCPIVVALLDDSVEQLMTRIAASGGAANVVLPKLNGFIVIAIDVALSAQPLDEVTASARDLVRGDCTVGVFLERIKIDVDEAGGETAAYQVVVNRGGRQVGRGHAELVAIGA